MSETARVTTLADLVRSTRGSVQTGPFGTVLKAAEYSRDGVPVVSVGELGYGAIRVHPHTRRVGPEVRRRLPEYELKPGDIVLGRKGAVDRSAVVREAQAGWFLGSDGIRIRLGMGVNPVFVGYALLTNSARQQLVQNSTGTTMATLNQRVFESVIVWLPPLHEQQKIAQFLDDASDDLLDIERFITKKRDIKIGIMQELLTGKTRLPGFTEPWTTTRIGEFAQVRAGGTPSTLISRYWGGNILWMSSGEVHKKRIWDVEGRISEDGFRESSAHLLPVGTVLIALAGQGKTRGTAAVSRVELTTNQSMAGIFPSRQHDPNFLFYNLDARYEELRGESAGGGGRGGLNLAIIKNLEVRLPSRDEQRAIGKVLADIDDEIDALERRLFSAQAIKQGMMQELLTGRTRVPAERVAT